MIYKTTQDVYLEPNICKYFEMKQCPSSLYRYIFMFILNTIAISKEATNLPYDYKTFFGRISRGDIYADPVSIVKGLEE